MMKSQINTSGKICKVLAILLSLLLISEQSGFAQIAGQLDISGHLAGLHNAFTPDVFWPLHLRYLSYNPSENNFQLFLDKGSLKNPNPQELEDTTKTLLNYFFVGITLPNDTFWVNLRPDAEDDIIDEQLAQTDVGKIMLESDLQLKKDTAKFTSPETPEGREYWDKLYKKAGEIFGSENITIPTLTRPWIVPDEIIIRETSDSAYIYKATLKVMLEQDYLKDSAVYSFKDDRLKELNEYSSQLIREIIIPKLTKEVNSSKRYASLRQVYYSLIMAQWFKARYNGKNGLYSRLIDRRDLTNLTSKEDWSKTTYFQAYQKSFKDGEYNIKEPVYTPFGQTIRSYFSGGELLQIPRMPSFGSEITTETGGRVVSSPATRDFNANSSPILAEMSFQANNLGEVVVRGENNPSAVTPTVAESTSSSTPDPRDVIVLFRTVRDGTLLRNTDKAGRWWTTNPFYKSRGKPTYQLFISRTELNRMLKSGEVEDTSLESEYSNYTFKSTPSGATFVSDGMQKLIDNLPDTPAVLERFNPNSELYIDWISNVLNAIGSPKEEKNGRHASSSIDTDFYYKIIQKRMLSSRTLEALQYQYSSLKEDIENIQDPSIRDAIEKELNDIFQKQEEIIAKKQEKILRDTTKEINALRVPRYLKWLLKFERYRATIENKMPEIERRISAVSIDLETTQERTLRQRLLEQREEFEEAIPKEQHWYDGKDFDRPTLEQWLRDPPINVKINSAKEIIRYLPLSTIRSREELTDELETLLKKNEGVFIVPDEYNPRMFADEILNVIAGEEFSYEVIILISLGTPKRLWIRIGTPFFVISYDIPGGFIWTGHTHPVFLTVYENILEKVTTSFKSGFKNIKPWEFLYHLGLIPSIGKGDVGDVNALIGSFLGPFSIGDMIISNDEFTKRKLRIGNKAGYIEFFLDPQKLRKKYSLLVDPEDGTIRHKVLYKILDDLNNKNQNIGNVFLSLFTITELKLHPDLEKVLREEHREIINELLPIKQGDKDKGGSVAGSAVEQEKSTSSPLRDPPLAEVRKFVEGYGQKDLIEAVTSKFINNRVVAIGENHAETDVTPAISAFIISLIPHLKKAGVTYVAIEFLEHSANELLKKAYNIYQKEFLKTNDEEVAKKAVMDFFTRASELSNEIDSPSVAIKLTLDFDPFTKDVMMEAFRNGIEVIGWEASSKEITDYADARRIDLDKVFFESMFRDEKGFNVIDRLLKTDPGVKIFLYGGADHTSFLPGSLSARIKEVGYSIYTFVQFVKNSKEKLSSLFNRAGIDYACTIPAKGPVANTQKVTQKSKGRTGIKRPISQLTDEVIFYGGETLNSSVAGSPVKGESAPLAAKMEAMSALPEVNSDKGGIDFRTLPIVTQAMTNLSANISSSALQNLVSINLDEEWQQIEKMASSGIIPSSERIKEYVQTSCAQDSITQDRDKILFCISDILRLEEERCDHTDATLRDILVVLESMGNTRELRQVFLGETI